ncbi:glycoside hydrolase family 35 protein [Mycena olivaceomarginata]|nr:glycoside hydrolase family 35 protein [Mycena olivaceomarginata]
MCHTGSKTSPIPMRSDSPIFPALARTDQVHFDNFSLILQGQRIFLHSGEFHTFRLPVPSLWPDILQKVKAAGLNAISIYTHMGLINPSRGVVDFDSNRALKPLYEAAMVAGLWITLRPGPYINAETTAGGLAHWTTTEVAGGLRTNSSDWRAAWQDYIDGIIRESAPYQISNGGPIIDNEYTQGPWGHAEYYAELEAVYRNSSIDVLLTGNDPFSGSNFINGTGAVDLYGIDTYPLGFDCTNPDDWNPLPTNYQAYHEQVNPSQAWFLPEYQGGSSDSWGPDAPGYNRCFQMTGPTFQSVFNRKVWASNAKLMNYYMIYGLDSQQCVSQISESRALNIKFDELKLQAIFLRSSPEFYKTDFIADSSSGLVASSNPAVFTTLLQNPDTQTAFYVLGQTNVTSTAITSFKMNITTVSGALQVPIVVPLITLAGRESKVVISDYSFGSSKVGYTTASVFYAGTIGGRDILFLHGSSNQSHEARLALTGTLSEVHQTQTPLITFTPDAHGTIVAFQPGIQSLMTVWDSDTQLVLFADSVTAATFWSPVLAGTGPFGSYWAIGSNSSILVGGPYLVRSAIISGSRLALVGDLNNTAPLSVIVPAAVESVTWNGERVALTPGVTVSGGFTGMLAPRHAVSTISVPKLTGWKFQDSLPEIRPDFDDSDWTVANHTTTNIPLKPHYGDGRILYGCDYGFCENVVLWRGHFESTGAQTSVNLSINGGEVFAASVWLNNVFLNTSFGNYANAENPVPETDQKFIFPPGALRSGDNVITVVQDNMGLSETAVIVTGNIPNVTIALDPDASKSPRGIRGFELDSGSFAAWKVQGKIGGYTKGEGGISLASIRRPGARRDLAMGLPGSSAGIGFFVTTFMLNVPAGIDAFMSFTFDDPLGQDYRLYLFVNGWMMGKRVANIGPQAKFPVHEGILNYHGVNTVAVALWSMGRTAVSPNLQLVLDGVLDGGVPNVTTNNPSWSPVGRI